MPCVLHQHSRHVTVSILLLTLLQQITIAILRLIKQRRTCDVIIPLPAHRLGTVIAHFLFMVCRRCHSHVAQSYQLDVHDLTRLELAKHRHERMHLARVNATPRFRM